MATLRQRSWETSPLSPKSAMCSKMGEILQARCWESLGVVGPPLLAHSIVIHSRAGYRAPPPNLNQFPPVSDGVGSTELVPTGQS